MFALFANRNLPAIRVVPTEAEFWSRFEKGAVPRTYFESQGDAHADMDLRLVEKIEKLLVPALGPWEQSSSWWHQMDFYGDGVRSLTFSRESFAPEFIPKLQALLIGEHEKFCILCQVLECVSESESAKLGAIAIYGKHLLITQGLAHDLSVVA